MTSAATISAMRLSSRWMSAKAAAGFQSRRGRWREPTPVNPHYAAFATYKAARVHRTVRRGGYLAARGAGAAGGTNYHTPTRRVSWRRVSVYQPALLRRISPRNDG